MPRGVKICPHCNSHNGPRALHCVSCSFDFFANKPQTQPKTVVVETSKTVNPVNGEQVVNASNLVFVPGKMPNLKSPFCPVPWKGIDAQQIEAWVTELRNYRWRSCGMDLCYARSAIIYFVDAFVPMYLKDLDGENPEYTRIVNLIKNVMPAYYEEIDTGYDSGTENKYSGEVVLH